MNDYPATTCPGCGRTEHTTVCSKCKTDKAEHLFAAYEKQRLLENTMKPHVKQLEDHHGK